MSPADFTMQTPRRQQTRLFLAAGALLLWFGALIGIDTHEAHAANSAAEYLSNSDADGSAGSRPLGGGDRYGTALLTAQRLAENWGGLGSVPTAVVVSGESAADGVAAVALTGSLRAPLLLTPPGELHRGVAGFLSDHDTRRILVVGGPAALSDRVVVQLETLEMRPLVERMWGTDRYATAARVAAEIAGQGSWCTSNDATVLLVDGTDRAVADAVSAGPLAVALLLPILLSAKSGLPEPTAEFLSSHHIDHVVAIGGATAIPSTVEDELAHHGVSTVTRVGGKTAENTAVAVAKLMRGDCAHALRTVPDMVALVRRDAPLDGLAAAVLLSQGVDGSGAVPLLLLGDSLPDATASWLAKTPIKIDERRVHMRIIAIGGKSAVSDGVMAEAVSAAATAGPFTATIEAAAGNRSFTVKLSDALDPTVPDARGKAIDMLYVNGAPALLDPTNAVDVLPGEPCHEPSQFRVGLRNPLQTGDVIEIRPTDVRLGARGDQRPLSPAVFVVPEPVADTTAPSIRAVIPVGAAGVRITADDADPRDLRFHPEHISAVSHRGIHVEVADGFDTEVLELLGAAAFDVALVAPNGYTRSSVGGGTESVEPGGAYLLEVGDRIIVRGGAVVDHAENRSRSKRSTVAAPSAPLQAVSVQITRSKVAADPDGADDSVGHAEAVLGGVLRVAARSGKAAAGAAGNSWAVRTSRRSTHDPAAEDIEIEVAISPQDRIISIRFADGTPEFGLLVDQLNADGAFSARFEATAVGSCTGRADSVDFADPDFDGTTQLRGGITSVEIAVVFNDHVREYLSDNLDFADDPARALAEEILAGLMPDDTSTSVAPGDTLSVDAPAPYDRMLFRYSTAEPSRDATLSKASRIVLAIRAGIARGYLRDDPLTDPDESLSAASMSRPLT